MPSMVDSQAPHLGYSARTHHGGTWGKSWLLNVKLSFECIFKALCRQVEELIEAL
jgi:hypothetical protein